MLTWILAALAGAVAAAGLFLIIRELAPAHPNLRSAIDRMSGADRPAVVAVPDDADVTDRVGAWVQRRGGLLTVKGVSPSNSDLDLIGLTTTRLVGKKVTFALVGLFVGPMIGAIFAAFGTTLPVTVPAGLALAAGALGWFFPDLEAKSLAEKARRQFSQAVSAYMDLLAIERISGAGVAQATQGAAEVATSWPFRRIAAALERGRWAGQAPWDALTELGDELDVRDLRDVANIMRDAGKEGSAIVEPLRRQAATKRKADLAADVRQAKRESVQIWVPVTAIAMIFISIAMYAVIYQL